MAMSSKVESCKGRVGLVVLLMLCLYRAAFAQAPVADPQVPLAATLAGTA